MSRFGKKSLAAAAATMLLALTSTAVPAISADGAAAVVSTTVDTTSGPDAQAIRAQANTYSQLFAKGDAAGLANMWTADGMLTDSEGHEYKGRAAIQNAFTAHFKEFGPHSFEINVGSVKFPTSTTAIEEGTTTSLAGTVPMRCNRYMAFHVKEGDQWKMAAVTETTWTPESAYEALKDLYWLVGKWSVKQPVESGIHFNANWVANRNFIKCEFEEATAPGTGVDPVKTTQLIGWDPIQKQIVSWHFDSSGGFGYGRWHREGKIWVIDANGVEQDGTTAKANYLLNPVDSNMFTWQSVARHKGVAALPDMPSITIGRDGTVQ